MASIQLETTEAGGGTTFTLALNTQPVSSVTIDVASSNPNEGEVAPATVIFTSSNWNQPQRLPSPAQDDLQADGDVTYEVVFSPSISDDPLYSDITLSSIPAVNRDWPP